MPNSNLELKNRLYWWTENRDINRTISNLDKWMPDSCSGPKTDPERYATWLENLSKIDICIDRSKINISIDRYRISKKNIAGFVFRAQNWSRMICNMAMFENLAKIDTLIDRYWFSKKIDIENSKSFLSRTFPIEWAITHQNASSGSSKKVVDTQTDTQTHTQTETVPFFTPPPNTFRSVYGASFARSSNSTGMNISVIMIKQTNDIHQRWNRVKCVTVSSGSGFQIGSDPVTRYRVWLRLPKCTKNRIVKHFFLTKRFKFYKKNTFLS